MKIKNENQNYTISAWNVELKYYSCNKIINKIMMSDLKKIKCIEAKNSQQTCAMDWNGMFVLNDAS